MRRVRHRGTVSREIELMSESHEGQKSRAREGAVRLAVPEMIGRHVLSRSELRSRPAKR